MSNAKTKTKTEAKTSAKKLGVVYTFGGQYFGKNGSDKAIKDYSLSITYPKVLEAPLSEFKGGLNKEGNPVRNLMVKSYPDFVRVRTFNLVSVVNNIKNTKEEANAIDCMNVAQLNKYIEKNDLGIDIEVYENDVVKIRQAIKKAEEDPEAFAIAYEKDVEEHELNKQLKELNPGAEGDETGDDENGEGDNGLDELLEGLEDGDEGDGGELE